MLLPMLSPGGLWLRQSFSDSTEGVRVSVPAHSRLPAALCTPDGTCNENVGPATAAPTLPRNMDPHTVGMDEHEVEINEHVLVNLEVETERESCRQSLSAADVLVRVASGATGCRTEVLEGVWFRGTAIKETGVSAQSISERTQVENVSAKSSSRVEESDVATWG